MYENIQFLIEVQSVSQEFHKLEQWTFLMTIIQSSVIHHVSTYLHQGVNKLYLQKCSCIMIDSEFGLLYIFCDLII